MNDRDLAEFRRLSSHTGREVTKIERLMYEFQGQCEREEGDVQLTIDGTIVHFRVSPDGETLRIDETPWRDPFSAPLSPENEEFVVSHGKWTLVDVSGESHFADMVGRSMSAVMPITNPFGRLIGVQLVAGEMQMNIYVSADEMYVSWGIEGLPRWGHE